MRKNPRERTGSAEIFFAEEAKDLSLKDTSTAAFSVLLFFSASLFLIR